ncbi:hypothetical protein L7F22_025851 [Adiantum nelumboides]|nr:hypothetical protein [Adiantum nelumboides]
MASGEGQSNPSTSGDAGGNHNKDYGNEHGPPLPTEDELREMEHRRLVGEATNMMPNFAKDPKLANDMTKIAFQNAHAQWKATTTSPLKPDSKKQYSEKELEEEIEARLARILGVQDKGKKHDKKRRKSTDFPGYLGNQMDGNKEEGSSSEDRQPIPIAHEIGESSSQAEKALQVVTAVTMFKQLMENPRFMEFIQSSSIAHQVQGSFGMPGTVFRGMQGMVPNPMYANIGLHPGFQGTQRQFGVSQGNVGVIEGDYIVFKRGVWLLDQFGVLHDGQKAYDGAIETLEKIAGSGVKLIVISNSSRRAELTYRRLESLGFDPSLFSGVITSGELTHEYLQRRQDPWFSKLGRRCLHITWSERGSISLEGLDLEVVENPQNADFILAHGTEALGLENGGVRPASLEELEALLAVCASKGISMVVANPDHVTVEAKDLKVMPEARTLFNTLLPGVRVDWGGLRMAFMQRFRARETSEKLWERLCELRAPDFLKRDRFVADLCPPLKDKVKARFPVTFEAARDVARLKERKLRYQLQHREADQKGDGGARPPPGNVAPPHRGPRVVDQQELLSRITSQLEDLSVHLIRAPAPPEQGRGQRRQLQNYHYYNCGEEGHQMYFYPYPRRNANYRGPRQQVSPPKERQQSQYQPPVPAQQAPPVQILRPPPSPPQHQQPPPPPASIPPLPTVPENRTVSIVSLDAKGKAKVEEEEVSLAKGKGKGKGKEKKQE